MAMDRIACTNFLSTVRRTTSYRSVSPHIQHICYSHWMWLFSSHTSIGMLKLLMLLLVLDVWTLTSLNFSKFLGLSDRKH